MGFLSGLLNRASGAINGVRATLTDFKLDIANKDDAQVGAHILIGTAAASGGVGVEEMEGVSDSMSAIFPNFTPRELSAFIEEAASSFKIFNVGVVKTRRLIKEYEETNGSFEMIMGAAVHVAQQGETAEEQAIDDKERKFLLDMIKARPDVKFTPADIGL